LLPPDYQKPIDKEEFLSSCVAADKKEYKNIFRWYHVYHPSTSFGNLPIGCEELYKQVLSMFKLNKIKQASFLLGGLVHYVSDICMPLHTAQESWETEEIHRQIEKEAEDYMFKFQPEKEKIGNIFTYTVELSQRSYKNYDILREKAKRPEVLKQQFVLACNSSFSVVYDILQQVASSTQSQPQQSALLSNTYSADYEAEVKIKPQSEETKAPASIQPVKKTYKPPVRVMGVILSPNKEYRLKLIPDGSGNFYLDIWEEQE